MQCFGICKPNVRIQFRVNNNVTFTKPSLNNIKEAVNHILGRKIMSNMEWIESKDAEVGIFEIVRKIVNMHLTIREMLTVNNFSIIYLFSLLYN